MMYLLAGDIGGTKTTLALFPDDRGPEAPAAEKTYQCRDFGSLEDIIRSFLAETGTRSVSHACLGVAGPVIDGSAAITNLPWTVDRSTLLEDPGFREVKIINDLEAMAESIAFLHDGDFSVINRGVPVVNGPRAIIAPGTGLGQAYLAWNGSRYVAHASEGGHADFGPLDGVQVELLRYLMNRFDHVSYELICSGTGIPNIYDFLKERGIHREPEWLSGLLSTEQDRTAAIIRTAMDPGTPCGICSATLELFVSVLAAEAGNLALKTLCTGGLFLGGGIPPRILPVLKTDRFFKTFTSKGRLGRVLESIPFSVILNPRAGLIGAAVSGLRDLARAS